MSTPYLPPRDADFSAWLTNFDAVAVADPGDYDLTEGQTDAITAVTAAFNSALTVSTDPSTRTPTSVAAKDTARTDAEAVVRPIASTISRNAAISNELKSAIGVTIPIVTPSPVPPPVTAPALILSSAVIGLLNLQYRDSTTPNSRMKPVGVIGAELWVSIGTVAATSPAQCTFAGMFTKTPLQLPTGAEGGKVVTVFARWANRSGAGGVAAVGPWSGSLVTFSL